MWTSNGVQLSDPSQWIYWLGHPRSAKRVCANKHRVNHIQSSRNQQGNTIIQSYSIINGLSSLVGWLAIILFKSFGTPTRELSSNKETWTLGELLGSSRGIDDQSQMCNSTIMFSILGKLCIFQNLVANHLQMNHIESW